MELYIKLPTPTHGIKHISIIGQGVVEVTYNEWKPIKERSLQVKQYEKFGEVIVKTGSELEKEKVQEKFEQDEPEQTELYLSEVKISGVGPATQRKLEAIGIITVDDLGNASVEDLVDAGIKVEAASNILLAVKEMA